MLFNSGQYAVFFVLVFLVAWAMAHRIVWRNLFLGFASLLFYMCWNPVYVLLIIASSFVDFISGARIHRNEAKKHRKLWLSLSLIANLGILFTFKYLGFATNSLTYLTEWFGWSIEIPHLDLLLPVGISFYTFQSMSYTLDIYYGKLKPTRSFTDFLMYVSFFPQLVAGPIVRARDFLPQLKEKPTLAADEAGQGLYRIIMGLVKKVLISDFLAINLVDRVFEFPEMYSSLEILVALYAYSLQIYCDFSGYSDIAIGSARLLGFHLPENFDLPYKAQSIREYWRRWHMSLSTWLRDYLYVPLGGSGGRFKWAVYKNLFLTMLLGGLWHGAAWTYVVWGALHGALLAATHWWGRRKIKSGIRPKRSTGVKGILLTLATFHFVTLAFVIFRSGSFPLAMKVYEHLFAGTLSTANLQPLVLLAIAAGYAGHYLPERGFELLARTFRKAPAAIQATILLAVAYVLGQVAGSDVVPFIYFQF